MKKTKRNIVACIALIILFTLSACGGDNPVAQEANIPNGDTLTVENIQDNPAYYVGTITLVGVVGNSGTQDFALQNKAGTFEVLVDYRGSQALPQIGDIVSVEGTLRENRPCCGPGFTITSTRFEAVE